MNGRPCDARSDLILAWKDKLTARGLRTAPPPYPATPQAIAALDGLIGILADALADGGPASNWAPPRPPSQAIPATPENLADLDKVIAILAEALLGEDAIGEAA